MKALILNSGMGSRMGALTAEQPKCLTELSPGETILSRQLRLLGEAGITQTVMTTGPFDAALRDACARLAPRMHFTFVLNPRYRETNYIYSIYCARQALEDELLLLHGDLVFEGEVLERLLSFPHSCMAVSSRAPLPEKDFKAVVREGRVQRVDVSSFCGAVAAQPLYRLKKEDGLLWLDAISAFCEAGRTRVYAEDALNSLNGRANIFALDIGDLLCAEVDTPEDLSLIRARLNQKDARQQREPHPMKAERILQAHFFP